jgi:subtilase family serine protease
MMKPVRSLYLCIVIAAMLTLLVHPVLADYNFDGVPSTDQLVGAAYGTINGGVYVDGGHGVGFSPYTQSFNVPESEVKWARLYVGVWGGNEENTGSVAVTFNDRELETLELEGEADTNSNVYCSGHGVYWIVYDVTGNQATGSVDAVVTTSGTIDGRVYGVVLVAVYEDPYGQEVQYWINEGNVNLHGPGWSGEHGTNDEAVTENE